MSLPNKLAVVAFSIGFFACGNDNSGSASTSTGSGGGAPTGSRGAARGGIGGSDGGSSGGAAQGAGGQPMGSGGSAPAGGSNGSGGAQGGAGAAPEAGIMPGSSDGAVDRSAPDAQNARDGATRPKRVLLYHFSTLVIPTVPAQLTFLRSKLTEWQYESDDSVDPAQFTDDNLSRYGAVAMVNTCFEPFGAGKPDRPQSEALQRFVQRGGGLFGTHCAAVTFQSAQPPVLYNQLIGGRGGGVPFDGTSDCRKLADHASSALLPPTFAFIGNLDEADYVAPDSVVLVRCKRAAPDGKDVAVSWYRTEGSGRVFYTNFAKVDADLKDPTLGAQHILPGLSWILGR